jgi:hypothetical protein
MTLPNADATPATNPPPAIDLVAVTSQIKEQLTAEFEKKHTQFSSDLQERQAKAGRILSGQSESNNDAFNQSLLSDPKSILSDVLGTFETELTRSLDEKLSASKAEIQRQSQIEKKNEAGFHLAVSEAKGEYDIPEHLFKHLIPTIERHFNDKTSMYDATKAALVELVTDSKIPKKPNPVLVDSVKPVGIDDIGTPRFLAHVENERVLSNKRLSNARSFKRK